MLLIPMLFTILVGSCVAAIGVVHFSVRGFGCALFIYKENAIMDDDRIEVTLRRESNKGLLILYLDFAALTM